MYVFTYSSSHLRLPLNLINSATHFHSLGHQLTLPQKHEILPHRVLEIREGLKVKNLGLQLPVALSQIPVDYLVDVSVLEREHAAASVLDQGDGGRVEELLGDDYGAQGIGGGGTCLGGNHRLDMS